MQLHALNYNKISPNLVHKDKSSFMSIVNIFVNRISDALPFNLFSSKS